VGGKKCGRAPCLTNRHILRSLEQTLVPQGLQEPITDL